MPQFFSRETIPVWGITALSAVNIAFIIDASPRTREDFVFILVGVLSLHFQALRNSYQPNELSPSDKRGGLSGVNLLPCQQHPNGAD